MNRSFQFGLRSLFVVMLITALYLSAIIQTMSAMPGNIIVTTAAIVAYSVGAGALCLWLTTT